MATPPNLKDSDFVALCAHYLDIKFDLGSVAAGGEPEHFSSPSSDDTDRNRTASSNKTDSTVNTTPLRPHNFNIDLGADATVENFHRHLYHADLPAASKDTFLRLSNDISQMGAILLSNISNDHPNDVSAPGVHHGRGLQTRLHQFDEKVKEQLSNIKFIQSMAPFQVEPALEDLWCNYRQKTQLIVKYMALPCRTERRLLENISQLFDAYVYNPFLRLLQFTQMDTSLENMINTLYDLVMTVLHDYRIWMKEVKQLKQTHMLPILSKIQGSPEVLQAIEDFARNREATKEMIRSGTIPGTQPLDKMTLEEIRVWSMDLVPMPQRTKNKYRREHTI